MVRYKPVDYDPFAPASSKVSLKPVDYDPFAPKKKPTDFIDDMQRGAGQAIAAVGSALRDVPIKDISILGQKAEEYGNKVVQANPADMPSVQEIKSVGDALNFASERVAEIIPQAVAPLAAAGVATLAGAAAPVVGAASLGAGALSSFGQSYGGIREQQREQGIEDKARAAAFAAPSAALDILGVGRFVPGAGRVLGDIVETGLKGVAKTGARVGAEEGVTEVAQTALERGGALKPLTDEEAQAEYLNALAAGAVGGGTIGAGGAAVRTVTGQPTPEAEPGTEPPPPPPAVEPEPVVPATSFGVPPEAAPIPVSAAPEENVIIEDDQVIIESPDGSLRTVPRAEYDEAQRAAAAPPVAEPVAGPVPEPFAEPVAESVAEPVAERAKPVINEYTIDDAIDSDGPEQVRIVRRPDGAYIMRGEQLIDVSGQVEAGMSDEQIIASRIGEDTTGVNVRPVGAAPAPTPVPTLSAEISRGNEVRFTNPQGNDLQGTVVRSRFNPDLGRTVLDIDVPGAGLQNAFADEATVVEAAATSAPITPAPTPAPAAPAVAPAPSPAKPPRARKLPAPPKAANTMQAYIAQIAKTFKKGQDRYSFESAVDAGVDPDWLNSRADLRRMFGKEKLTRGRDGKVIQNQRQINENLKSFSDLAMGFQPKDWGLYGESLDENGYVLPAALADLINNDAPRYDPTTGRPYEQEAQEEDYGFEATVQAVSREASDLGVDLTDADMRAIAEKIGADGDPLQGIVDYVNEQFEEVMAEARDYSEYDAGQEEFPDGPVTNIEDSTAEPGVSGQAAAPGDAGQGQADREQPAGAAPQVEEGSLGLSAEQAAPQGGMTERQRAEMQARLQQSQMRRGNQEALDQQEGGMFDASRDQDGLFKSVEAALPAAQAEALEEARKVPSLSRGVRKLLKQWGAGRIDDGMLASNIADLAEYIDYMKDGRNYRLAQKGRARGADRIMEALLREKRRGNVSAETVDFVEWALKANPNLAENLAISVRAPGEKSPAGQYDHVRRLMTLFKNRASDTTAVHEMLHHTERMMPPDVQAEIRKTWLREFNKAAEKGKPNAPIDTFFQALRALHGRTKFTVGNETFAPDKGLDIAINLINQGFVPYSYYQYVNPSEFWAVNATDIMRKRFDVKDSTLARIRNWLSELAEKAKGLFNLSATSPLIKALDSLAKADGKFNSLTMLQEEGARYLAPRRPPSGPPPSGPQPSLFPSPQPPSLVLPKETRGQRYSRKLVDRFERLRVVQSLGQLAAGIEGFYEAARKFDSRAGELMAKFNRDYFQPIEKIMKEAGLNLETVDAFLYARAAPARNARLKAKAENEIRTKMENKIRTEMEADGAAEADIQAAIADADADIQAAIAKAAADGKIPEAGSGMTTQEATDIMNGFRGQDYFPALERIGEIFNRANKERMQNNIQRGLVSREVGEQLLREEPDYVPMKGSIIDENLTEPAEDFEDVMGYGGSGFGVSVREWYNTRGRTSLGFSPLGTFISDVGTSIVRGERNRVGQKLMTFFIDNPSESWKVFSYRNPPRNRNGDIQRPSPFDPNFMVVKRGGDTFYLRIDDPLLAKAAKNLNPQQMNSLLQISSNLTRMLSRSFTTANPDFFVPNVFRDLQSAALNLGAEAPGLLKAFRDKIKDGKAFRSVAAFEYGREGGDPALRELYEQFKLDGGSVSWVQRETPQEAAARIQKDLKTVNDSLKDLKDARSAKQAIEAVWNPTGKGFRAMVGALESTNATFENSVRFAAYRAALEIGMTREQAAMISREATVDFNRRGEAGALLNALYAFFNAGIQGSVRTARALSNNPLKTGKLSTTQAALLGMMTTAATLAAANAALSDEDDDGKLFWDKIPDYEKERNLIIMNPLDGKTYTKIPMPYGFGFFPYLATRTMDAARRGDDLGAVGLDIATAGLGNFSPVQFSAGNIPSSIARAATPTMGKPFVELMLNENFMGKPIYNEPFDKGQSYASVARFNTPEGYKELSQFLNDISGGEGKLKGNLNAPAESFEYLTEFAFGGVTNLAKSLYRTGEEGDAVAAPVVRRLVGQPGKGRNVGEYYEREERARVVNQQMKDLTGLERRALIEKFPAETNPRVQSALTATRSAVRKLNEERKRIRNLDIDEGVKAERLEALRERTDAEFVRFNRIYNQVEQATR